MSGNVKTFGQHLQGPVKIFGRDGLVIIEQDKIDHVECIAIEGRHWERFVEFIKENEKQNG